MLDLRSTLLNFFFTMNFPETLRYTKEHEWIVMESADVARVGITDFAQSELGDIVFVDLKSVGTKLNANDIFGTVEAVKTVSDLFLPVAGEIIEVNEALKDASLVNKSPYGDGWMIKLKVNNPKDVEALMTAADYRAQIGQ
jgi:glycine cleavage system H protein